MLQKCYMQFIRVKCNKIGFVVVTTTTLTLNAIFTLNVFKRENTHTLQKIENIIEKLN